MNILLVHGFLNRGGVFGGLIRHLSRQGHVCYAPSLRPCDGRSGIPDLARQLAAYVDHGPLAGSKMLVIGFSMGALVARHYLQDLGGHARAVAFLSLCGPHQGTVSAYLYPGAGTRQMRPGSAFLAQLDQTADRLGDLPVVCYWTPFDLMIRPVASTRWPRGEAVRIPSLLHFSILFDRRLYRDIDRRIAALQA